MMYIRFFAVLILLASHALTAGDLPAVGQPAPPFALRGDHDSTVTLEGLRGQWVVLYFYPKNFTGGCTMEAQNFQRDLEKYRAAGATIIGVSMDGVESHQAFCSQEGLQFRLLSDVDGAVSASYGSLMERGGTRFSARNTFIIDPKGTIAAVFAGVKPAGHSEEVLAELARLQQSGN